MKLRTSLRSLSALSLVVALASCSNESAVLRLNVDENFSTTATTTMHMAMDITQGAEGQQMESDMEFELGLSGKAKSEAGNQVLVMSFENMRTEMTMDTMHVVYDTRDGATELSEDAMAMAALRGVRMEIEFSDRGDALQLLNKDEFADKVLDNLDQPDSMKVMMRGVIAQQFNIEQVQSQIGIYNLGFPEEAVTKGSTWTTENAQGGQLPLLIKTTYTVVSVSDSEVVLDVTGEIIVDPSAGPMASMMEMSGTQTGSMTVDRATGWIKTQEGSLTVDGSMNMPGAPQGGMTLKMQADYTTESSGM